MFTSMMGWGGGGAGEGGTNLHKKKQRILMAIGRNPEKKNHPVWDWHFLTQTKKKQKECSDIGNILND